MRVLRLGAILAIGGALIFIASRFAWRDPHRPAEMRIQTAGQALLRDILERSERTEVDETERGRLLREKLTSLFDSDGVLFTHDLDERARFYPRPGDRGGGVVYVDAHLVEIGDEYGLAKVLFHEAVHALRPQGSSIEEECDAYVAGVTVADAIAGRATPWAVRVDGVSLAEFVSARYPGLERDPEYEPVAQDRAWLEERSGLVPAPGR